MNTRIGYRYTDKTDCRQYTAVVVSGTITWAEIEPYLAGRRGFIPGQLGLEDLQLRFALPGSDQPWHQIHPEDIRPTEAAPTIELSGPELAERFATAVWQPDWRLVAPPPPRPRVLDALHAPPSTPAASQAATEPWPVSERVRRSAKR